VLQRHEETAEVMAEDIENAYKTDGQGPTTDNRQQTVELTTEAKT
jgi:hypothetical protein